MAKVNIKAVEGERDLYMWYAGQSSPQPVYIGLDLEDGEIRAFYRSDIGGGCTARQWNGVERTFLLDGVPTARAANAIMADPEVQGLAQAILDGATVDWNGSNWVGGLSEEAADAESQLEVLLGDSVGERIQTWETGDWMCFVAGELTPGMTDDEIENWLRGIETERSDDGPIELTIDPFIWARERVDELNAEAEEAASA